MTMADASEAVAPASAKGGVTLASFNLCPCLRRATIVIAQKGVAFKCVHVDLANKPD